MHFIGVHLNKIKILQPMLKLRQTEKPNVLTWLVRSGTERIRHYAMLTSNNDHFALLYYKIIKHIIYVLILYT